jgi:hypothetical protein
LTEHNYFIVFRHCLWIIGNSNTLEKSGSVWQKIVSDAKKRGCLFKSEDDKELHNAIIKAVIEQDELQCLIPFDSLHISRTKSKVNTTIIDSYTHTNTQKQQVTRCPIIFFFVIDLGIIIPATCSVLDFIHLNFSL